MSDAPALPAGVNLAGYLDATLGAGEAARLVAVALEEAGVAVARITLPSAGPRSGESPDGGEAPHAVTVVCANPAGMTGAVDAAPNAFAGRRVVGLWWWEATVLPARWQRAFDLVDEVWAGSRFVADVFAAVSPVPVVHMPFPVAEPRVARRSRADLGLAEDRFLLGFAFDHASVTARKNPLGLVEAFRRAFAPDDGGVGLVIKTLGGDRHPEAHRALLRATDGDARVVVIDREAPVDEKNALIAALDGYVSLHRAEGLGLTIAEAMLLGVPVVATGYGGASDLVTHATALPVDHRLIPVGPGNDPYPPEAQWAEPDLDHAAALLRELRADRQGARRRAARAREQVRRDHSPAAAGRAMAERLARILGQPYDGRGRVDALALDDLLDRLAAAPEADAARNVGPRGALRRALLRALRPHTAHQRLVDDELVRALRTLDERVQGLAAGQQALAAELARLRRAQTDPSREDR